MEPMQPTESQLHENISTITSTTFKSFVLQEKGPIAVEFMSYACSHCGTLEPIIQQVAEMLKSKVKVFRVNTVTEPRLASTYKIVVTPTLIMFLNGKSIGRIDGPSPTVSGLLTAMAQPFRGHI